jgi:hypothetical protein
VEKEEGYSERQIRLVGLFERHPIKFLFTHRQSAAGAAQDSQQQFNTSSLCGHDLRGAHPTMAKERNSGRQIHFRNIQKTKKRLCA